MEERISTRTRHGTGDSHLNVDVGIENLVSTILNGVPDSRTKILVVHRCLSLERGILGLRCSPNPL